MTLIIYDIIYGKKHQKVKSFKKNLNNQKNNLKN